MRKAKNPEFRRVKEAAFTGVSLASVLIFASAAFRISDEFNIQTDWSYFRVNRPQPATVATVKSLQEKVTIFTFFPPRNEVGHWIIEYLEELKNGSQWIQHIQYDQSLDVKIAQELGVRSNGQVVIQGRGTARTITLPLKFSAARQKLSEFDRDMHKAIVGATRPVRIVYYLNGHGERLTQEPSADSSGMVADQDSRPPVSKLAALFQSQNVKLKPLSAGEGLLQDIPADAAAVLILGPRQELSELEEQSMTRYLRNNGRALVALDAEYDVTMNAMLNRLGVVFDSGQLLNQDVYYPSRRDPSDFKNLISEGYSTHDIVESLQEGNGKLSVFFRGAGSLEPVGTAPRPGIAADILVRAHPRTWVDRNENGQWDEGEERGPHPLAAALLIKGKDDYARLVLLGDSDVLADDQLAHPGNLAFANGIVRWLIEVEANIDLTGNVYEAWIDRSKSTDVFWFYTTIFLIPALIFATGHFVVRFSRGAQ